MSKQDTVVDWLEKQIRWEISNSEKLIPIFEQAKEIEKQQIEYAETKDIQQLIDRNYAAQIRRGQINDKTKPHNFLTKINEELEEVMQSDTWEEMADEVNDLKMVCESYLKYLYENAYITKTPQQIHLEKVEYNEKRKD